MFDEVTKLTFTNNGELAAIDLTGFAAKLQTLNVAGNKLTQLTGISKCTKIVTINASKNKMTELGIAPALTQLQTLDVTDNELSKLTLPDEAKDLKTVKVGGNKLAYANINANAVATIKANKGTLTWGTQEYELTNVSSIQNWYANHTNNSLKVAIKEFFGTEDAKNFTFAWTKEGETTSDANQDKTYLDKFTFHDNSKYQYGTYGVKITGKAGTAYEGVSYTIPEIKVTPAQFTFQSIEDAKVYLDNERKIKVEPGTTVVKQGQSLTVYAEKEDGLELDKFEFSGLELLEDTQVQTWTVFKVTGALSVEDGAVKPEVLTLKSTYKPAVYELTVRATKGGEVQVSYKDANNNPVTVRNGDEIPYGAWLDITVLAEEGYTFEQLRNGYDTSGEAVLKPEEGKANYFKLQVKEDVDLVPVFEKEVNVSLYFKYPESNPVLVMRNNQQVSYADATKKRLSAQVGDVITVLPQRTTSGNNYADLYHESFDYIVVGTKQIPVVNGSASFTVTASTDVTLVFAPLQKIEILPLEGKKDGDGIYNHKITYTGKPYAYPYRTTPNTPAGNDGVEVDCRLSSTTPEAPNLGNPTNVGAYAYIFSRPADKKFKKAATVTARLTIEKATPTISELPTVTVENGKFVLKGGKAVFGGEACPGTFKVATTSVPTASGLVSVEFAANDTHNFNKATAQVPVIINNKAIEKFAISIAKQLPAGVEEIVIKNGDYIVADGAKVEKSMKLSFETVLAEGYYYDREDPEKEGNFFLANEAGEKIQGTDITTVLDMTKDHRVNVTAPKKDNPRIQLVVNQTILSQEVDYTVAAQKLKIEKLGDLIQNASQYSSDVKLEDFIIKYFDKENNEIDLPMDAGTYKVTLYRPADDKYKAVSEEGRLIINPLTAKITKVPTASLIAQGLPLSDATLSRGLVKATLYEGTPEARQIDVAGTFKWEEDVKNPVSGQTYRITFVPDDQVNFLCDATDAQVAAKVSNKMIVTSGNPQNGSIVIMVEDGRVLESGDEIVKGEKLVITAEPNEGFELATLTVNGEPFENGSTYTVGEESVSISATFKVKETIIEKPVPGDPTAVKVILRVNAPKGGYILNKPLENVVDFGEDFTFTVRTAEADQSKLSVVGGENTNLAAINNRYTLSEIKQDTVITITLLEPTKLKVEIEKETKNEKGYLIGKVEIDNESKDSTYYYGDELIMVAYPESGVSFANWSDDRSESEKYRTYVVTEDAVIKPVFSGAPTDIEEIETAEIYGSEGCIILRGIGEANVTIVSMDGRARKQTVSGDTQIYTAAGIYGVILEQGSEVKRVKVIVR